MQLNLAPDRLQIELNFWEQLWAFRFEKFFEIPLTHITKVTSEEPLSTWKELKAPGTFLPGVIKAGTYYTSRGKEFWYVTQDQNYLTLELKNESYQRIVLTLEQNEMWISQIQQRLNLFSNES